MTGEPSTSVARGYSWPPFQPGHEVSIRSGAWSKRRLDPVVSELVAGLMADRPDLIHHPEAVHAWARAEARCLLLDNHYEGRLFDADGSERPGLRYLGQFERLAAELRARLGLDPTSEAALAKERVTATLGAVDLDAIRDKGRAAMATADRDHAVTTGENMPSDQPVSTGGAIHDPTPDQPESDGS